MEGIHGHEDGGGITPREPGLSPSVAAAEAELVCNGDRFSISAAHGRYLAVTSAPAPVDHGDAEAEASAPACLVDGFWVRHDHAGDVARYNIGRRRAGTLDAGSFRVLTQVWVARAEAASVSLLHGRPEEVLGRSATSSRHSAEQMLGKDVSFLGVISHGGADALKERRVLGVGASPRGRVHADGEGTLSAGHDDGLSVSSPYIGATGTPVPRGYRDNAEVEAAFGEDEQEAEALLREGHPCAGQAEQAPCIGGTTLEDAEHGEEVTAALGEAECSTAGVKDFVPPEGDWGACDIFIAHGRTGLGYCINALKLWVSKKLGIEDYGDDIPLQWSWVNMMGPPIYQTDPKTTLSHDHNGDGSCVICACMTCVHALHRLAFERRHGAGSFPYELCRDAGVLMMKYICFFSKIWSPVTGSRPSWVLQMMINHTIGLALRDIPDRYLRIRSFDTFLMKDLKPGGAVVLLRLCGPMIGRLHVSPPYFISTFEPDHVYRGVPGGGKSNHSVVCIAYQFVHPGELQIQVLDNHSRAGPLRWILFEAFQEFICIRVDALTPEELPRPRISLLRKLFYFLKR